MLPISINFINSGSDEALLKSMVGDRYVDQEELSKALDKTKLVQKEIQVKGKNGQMHTRKQWVRAGEEPKVDKQPKKQEDTDVTSVKGKNRSEAINAAEKAGYKMDSADKKSAKEGSKPPKSLILHKDGKEFKGDFNVYSDGGAEIVNIKPTGNDSSLDSKNKNYSAYGKAVNSKDYTGSKDFAHAVVQSKIAKQLKREGKEPTEKNVKEIAENIANSPVSGSNGGSLKQGMKVQDAAREVANGTYVWGDSDKSQSKTTSEFKSELGFKKDSDSKTGETWFEGDYKGHRVRILQEKPGDSSWWNVEIDSELSRDADNKALSFNSLKEAENEVQDSINNENINNSSSKSNRISDLIFNRSSNVQENKANLAKVLASGESRESIMETAKDSGISWKECDHPGINWMRCSVALTSIPKDKGKINNNTVSSELNKILQKSKEFNTNTTELRSYQDDEFLNADNEMKVSMYLLNRPSDEQLAHISESLGITANGGSIFRDKDSIKLKTSDGTTKTYLNRNGIVGNRPIGAFLESRGVSFDENYVDSKKIEKIRQITMNEDGTPKKRFKYKTTTDFSYSLSGDGKHISQSHTTEAVPNLGIESHTYTYSDKVSKKIPKGKNYQYQGDITVDGKNYMVYSHQIQGTTVYVED